MKPTIRFACQSDENELRDLFLYYDMDLAGDIEEHVIIEQGDEVRAGGMLSQVEACLFHLQVLAVSNDKRGTGAGQLLLSNLLLSPWLYCHGSVPEKDQSYTVTTVSRGDAVPFYAKYGFRQCSFSNLTEPYNEQCNTCPDMEKCQPVPMYFVGVEKL